MSKSCVTVFEKAVLLCIILSIGCGKNYDLENPIIDTWFLFENAYRPGSGLIIREVEFKDAPIYEIKENGEFTFWNGELMIGKWAITDDVILFTFDEPNANLTNDYYFTIQENVLTLWPATRFCIEGCYWKYRVRAQKLIRAS